MQRQGPVLVVDDEPDVGALLVALLESEGYRTAIAQTGKQAIELVAAIRPAAIVLDLSLPDLDGRHVLHLLKGSRETASIPVIVVSAYTGQLTAADKALLHGVFEKPFDLDELTEAMGRLHDRGRREIVRPVARHRSASPTASVA